VWCRGLPPPQRYGTTPPISLAAGTEEDVKQTAEMKSVLVARKLFEPQAEAEKREMILAQLNTLIQDWVRDVSLREGLSEAAAAECNAKIFTYGSYRLGVHLSGGDIDALCVAPMHIRRDLFFSEFYERLKNDPHVTEPSVRTYTLACAHGPPHTAYCTAAAAAPSACPPV
jgi:poly(A) polymerase